MHVILRPLLRYADFSGRASRAEYWLFGLIQSVLYGFILLFAALSLAGLRDNPAGAIGGAVLSVGIFCLVALGLFIPNLALLARRMHDINISAWWMGLMVPGYLAQGANFQAAFQAFRASSGDGNPEALQQAMTSAFATSGILSVLAMLCGLALFIIVLIPGNKGPNRFGNDPKDGGGFSPRRSPALDEARIDAAIAELKTETSHKPVFDFSPSSAGKPMMVARDTSVEAPAAATVITATTTSRHGVADAKPTFGRRR